MSLQKLRTAVRWPIQRYINLWRRLLPDAVYRLWLRTGVMEPEAYREFQRRGWIRDDADPDDIQREG